MANRELYIGLISGTSIDGIDCALVEFKQGRPSLLAWHSQVIGPNLKKKILALCANQNISLDLLGQVDIELGRSFAQGCNTLLKEQGLTSQEIIAIGSHGQTVFHQPHTDFPFSLQIGDPNTIAQRTGINTVADFRRRDMAVGGQGAPLAPLLHSHCFSSANKQRVILNIGGMSNITILAKQQAVVAFDTGPGNVLMDYWIDRHLHKSFDSNGDWAAGGTVDPLLLATLLQEDYFSQPCPKSTGRELFNGQWLEQILSQLSKQIAPQDVQASLLELTASSIHTSISEHMLKVDELYVCGGGAHNSRLMQRLAELFTQTEVQTTEALNIHPDWVEATAFAWLAKQHIDVQTVDTRSITGATQTTLLGGMYPAN